MFSCYHYYSSSKSLPISAEQKESRKRDPTFQKPKRSEKNCCCTIDQLQDFIPCSSSCCYAVRREEKHGSKGELPLPSTPAQRPSHSNCTNAHCRCHLLQRGAHPYSNRNPAGSTHRSPHCLRQAARTQAGSKQVCTNTLLSSLSLSRGPSLLSK